MSVKGTFTGHFIGRGIREFQIFETSEFQKMTESQRQMSRIRTGLRDCPKRRFRDPAPSALANAPRRIKAPRQRPGQAPNECRPESVEGALSTTKKNWKAQDQDQGPGSKANLAPRMRSYGKESDRNCRKEVTGTRYQSRGTAALLQQLELRLVDLYSSQRQNFYVQ